MQILSHKAFLKAYDKLQKERKIAVDKALIVFSETPNDPALHDHALKGKMKGLRSFSAGFDLRVIYKEEGGFVTVLLLDVGTRNQVY